MHTTPTFYCLYFIVFGLGSTQGAEAKALAFTYVSGQAAQKTGDIFIVSVSVFAHAHGISETSVSFVIFSLDSPLGRCRSAGKISEILGGHRRVAGRFRRGLPGPRAPPKQGTRYNPASFTI